ncbi:type III secretion system translocon subunit SctB [Mailhella massiliensis]|uniref:Type III secretion system translocon subunit SctB n=1 Tax=Mailhella massiliensis TaxID=1903261 RepID=A0A921AUV1_9BACT|nr:type III secretion system translocon subunit SctB [Mailhella massiliensis]HJD96232.1 type III secretion system translocon subunit SctB [Mailhella massiliensis]
MSLSVNNLVGFNQTVYDDLKTKYTSATGKTDSDFDNLLISLSKDGTLSFQDVTGEVFDMLPKPLDSIVCPSTIPSFGSTYLALITELSSEERRQNAEMRALQTEEMVDKIQDQADTIRNKAVAQLVTGVITGTLSIAQGAASISITAKGIAANEKTANEAFTKSIDESTGYGTKAIRGERAMNAVLNKANSAANQARQQADLLLNSRVQAFNSMMTGSSGILGSIGQCVSTMYDAELKESEADVERIRAQQQQLESLDESLKALIQKALSTQDTIQQNINQTRTKILG